MEFGPIPGIRAVSLAMPRRTESLVQPRFEIDGSAKADEEGYSPSQQQAERGMDEEESDASEEQDAEAGVASLEPLQGTRVNFIA